MVQQTVYKSGSSLVVVVPSSFVEAIGIDKGDTVKVKIDYSLGKIEYSFSGNRQLTFDSNFTKTKKK